MKGKQDSCLFFSGQKGQTRMSGLLIWRVYFVTAPFHSLTLCPMPFTPIKGVFVW
jgi:hypothetical protein